MPDIFVRLEPNLEFLDGFSHKYPLPDFKEIRAVVAALIHTDRRTDMKRLKGTFRDYANAHLKITSNMLPGSPNTD
jgi:hypothetical protein